MVFLKEFLKKINLKKTTHRQQKSMQNYPACKELMEHYEFPIRITLLSYSLLIAFSVFWLKDLFELGNCYEKEYEPGTNMPYPSIVVKSQSSLHKKLCLVRS